MDYQKVTLILCWQSCSLRTSNKMIWPKRHCIISP